MRSIFLLLCIIICTSWAIDIEKVCQTIENQPSILFPFKCVSDEERLSYGARGEEYAKTHKITSVDPVILIPGIGGSVLDVTLTGAHPPHSYCYEDSTRRRLWLNLGLIFPVEVNCWYFEMGINYHTNNHTWTNNPGVEIDIVDWGGVEGIDYLDRVWGTGVSFTSYYAELIEDLKKIGYVPRKNLRGAPFDWRLADNPNGYFKRLQELVEETFDNNGQKQVHLIAHSYGNIQTSLFLNKMDTTWKDKYIGSFISIAAPWSGSPKSLKAIVSGDNFGIEVAPWLPILDNMSLRPLIRQAGGPILLVPEIAFWSDTEFVRTPQRSYTANDIHQLLIDIKAPITLKIFNYTDGIMENIAAPEVEMHCLYGNGFPTEMHFTYNDGWDNQPSIKYTNDGDGTVPIESLRRCTTFKEKQTQPVETKEFNLKDHFTVLTDPELLDYVLKIITHTV